MRFYLRTARASVWGSLRAACAFVRSYQRAARALPQTICPVTAGWIWPTVFSSRWPYWFYAEFYSQVRTTKFSSIKTKSFYLSVRCLLPEKFYAEFSFTELFHIRGSRAISQGFLRASRALLQGIIVRWLTEVVENQIENQYRKSI